MGIKNFFKWVRENFPESCGPASDLANAASHHVYIDVNGLLHELMHDNADILHEEQLFSRLFSKLDSILRALKPTRTVYLTLDGAPPRAKLFTMRNRRRKRWRTPQPFEPGSTSSTTTEPTFGANLITPGLPFMDRLQQAVEYYLADRMREGQILGGLELECAISGSGAPGEGEVKALRQLLRMAAGGFRDDRHVVVSSDADAMLSLLVQSAVRNVFVVRLGRAEQQSISWSRERFVAGLTRIFPNCEEEMLRREVVLLALLSGNDFLPGLCELPKIWSLYKEMRGSGNKMTLLALVQQGKLPMCFEEGGWCYRMGDSGEDLKRGTWAMVNPAQGFFELLRLYMDKVETGGGAVENQDEKAQCYIQGLMWQLQSFMTGKVLDHTFCYPWSTEAINVANLCSVDFNSESLVSPSNPSAPMKATTAALLVMPLTEARLHFPSFAIDELRREVLNGVDFLEVDVAAVERAVEASISSSQQFRTDVHLYYQRGSSLEMEMPKFPSLPLQFGARPVYPSFKFIGQRFEGFWPKATTMSKVTVSNATNSVSSQGQGRQGAKRYGTRQHRFYKPSFFDDPWRVLMK